MPRPRDRNTHTRSPTAYKHVSLPTEPIWEYCDMGLDEIRDRATLTVGEAAELLGVGRSCAYDAARRGDLPAVRLGRRLVVPVPALIRLLEQPIGGDQSA